VEYQNIRNLEGSKRRQCTRFGTRHCSCLLHRATQSQSSELSPRRRPWCTRRAKSSVRRLIRIDRHSCWRRSTLRTRPTIGAKGKRFRSRDARKRSIEFYQRTHTAASGIPAQGCTSRARSGELSTLQARVLVRSSVWFSIPLLDNETKSLGLKLVPGRGIIVSAVGGFVVGTLLFIQARRTHVVINRGSIYRYIYLIHSRWLFLGMKSCS